MEAKNAKLQAQVRGLTRDVGALREALRQEEGKRERLAAHAKACDEARGAAESKVKSLTYVNTKLEQEVRTARERGDATAAKSRAALDGLRGRLGDLEKGVHSRSVEAHTRVQRLHSAVQDLQAVAMPLAVAAAAAAATPGMAAPPPALKSPRPGGGQGRAAAAAAAQRAAAKPEQLHRGFAAVFAGLSQLAELFAGGGSCGGSSAATTPAPLLLTAPDGTARTVHWQDQNSPANSAATGGISSCAAGPAAATTGDADKQRLAAEVVRLRGALAEARKQAPGPGSGGQVTGGTGRVEAAMRQLDAVVPQYRAAAQALQGQVGVLRQQLTAAAAERAALREEGGKWRTAAQRHEAALAEAAAQLHSREAHSLAASAQVECQTSRLQSDVDALRRRCAELAGRLQEAQRLVAQLQGALAAKDKLSASQQQTIRQLEGTIREQQADIRAALALVTTRPGDYGEEEEDTLLGSAPPGMDAGYAYDLPGPAEDDPGGPYSSWDAGLAAAEDAAVGGGSGYASPSGANLWDVGAAVDETAGGAPGTDQLEALLGAATAAADAAAAWAGGYGSGGLDESADWLQDGGGGSGAQGWTIPAGAASPVRYHAVGHERQHQQAPSVGGSSGTTAAAVSLQGSPTARAGTTAADIAGLEQALRSALTDLSI